jgi:DNA-binding transcriptional ArsR family regulator
LAVVFNHYVINSTVEHMADQLSITLSALADPTRRGILARLATGEATVNQLAAPYDMSLAAVSKHLKVLEHAGLISRGKDAQFRPCKLEAGPMRDVAGWLEEYRKFWEASLDRLEDYLATLQKGDPNGPRN